MAPSGPEVGKGYFNGLFIVHFDTLEYLFAGAGVGAALVFKTFLKCGKLQRKSTFNKKEVCLLIIKHIETNQIVLYLPRDI